MRVGEPIGKAAKPRVILPSLPFWGERGAGHSLRKSPAKFRAVPTPQ